ncbi:Fic family protein [Mucilaginibacter psychrotolerans]|nr:Fic family protein [Mucilaginibacter psychrotolerans]
MAMIKTNSLHITNEILALIAEIDEFKGAWRSLSQLAPEQLTSLKHIATIESIGSSTRIEGSRLTDQEVEVLLGNLQIKSFATRDEQEIAGYAEAMNIVFQNYEQIPFTENYILQLHQELMRYSDKDDWHRGNYKKSPNHVEAFGADGKSIGIVFETISPFETPLQMEQLVAWANKEFKEKTLHPLIIAGIFIVKFLEIHPFQDGNGRLSRILTTLLLLKQGYAYIPYSSLEAVIEQSKEAYYLSLRQTQGTLKSEKPNWGPWLLFFLRSLKKQKERLEGKIAQEKLLLTQLPELSQRILSIAKSRGRITVKDVVTLTSANRNTVKKHIENLSASGYLQQQGIGKGTWYVLSV